MKRVQRSRRAGSRLPENTLVVTRGTPYGNPYPADVIGNAGAVEVFREWLKQPAQEELIRQFIRICEERGIENLACFCPLQKPCHADVWIEMWEAVKSSPAPFEMTGWRYGIIRAKKE